MSIFIQLFCELFNKQVFFLEEPGSFQGGFDHILKNIPKKQNDSLENENSPEILKSSVNSDQINVKAESSLSKL